MERSFWDYPVRDPLQERAARIVYLDLCEGRPQWDVKHCFDEELGIVYFHAAFNTPKATTETVVPLCSHSSKISPAKIEEWSSLGPGKKVVMALVADDADVLYYDVARGFQPPPLPEDVQAEKVRRERRRVARHQRGAALAGARRDEAVAGAADGRDYRAVARGVQAELERSYKI